MGYDAVLQAVHGLLIDPSTVEQSLGFVLSLALHNFSVSGVFETLQGANYALVDSRMADISPLLGIICQPGAIKVLWDALQYLPGDSSVLRYAVYKLLERLLYLNHRNQVVFNSLEIVGAVFDLFIACRANEKERHVLQKLLRRILDLGTAIPVSRLILQKAIKDDDSLDPDVLDVIRAGMKARWPEHFSMESSAALVLAQENTKGLPLTGFTYMVRFCFLVDIQVKPHMQHL